MDFFGSSAGEVVEAIGLRIDVGDIAAGQVTFGFEDASILERYLINTRG